MSRFQLRRGRILPGPLKSLAQVEPRSPVPVTSLALTSAVLAAGLLLMPHLSPQLSVDPTPMAEFAGSSDAVASAGSDAAAPVAAAPAAESVPAPPPLSVAAVLVPPAPPAAAPVVRSAAAVSAKPTAGDASLFQLDLLPVLRADGTGLEAAPAAAPQKAATRTAARRAMASDRGGPTQP